ncbi:2-polyprenyl-6-methoxyphenol hydroxylase-like FAD-dependent oxidoreductase [Pseudoduganella lurida]|uniref:2-polyprenyl-6-methoxyphenol hydroxylase-like FAD-dependent oxidoreductase n=1 Tax=Pseudoduganella lurida TaxID=1036180 RepID=A0A562RJT5_9BURK|nr:FAD-dependent monooxygenase [Pseudoduganella lurida]TWI69309.1 2-polyprenyl-6-methoxyphenol hydroxylase-like FAD-dependent oxidoreductase [Pseudoduganella lurida]
MKRTKSILICGAGVAGPACAWWLKRYGFKVVVAEKAASFREGGQNVDVKGAGQQVIAMMNLTMQIDAMNTGECGQKWLDAAGRVLATLPKGSVGGLTSDFEILRGNLARILFDATRDACDYRFGTSVVALDESAEGVWVTFATGAVEEFAMVICADGVGSSTRALALAKQTRLRYLGAYMAFFTIPRRAGDDSWAYSVNGIGGTMIHLRPGGLANTTVLVTFPAAPPAPHEKQVNSVHDARHMLRAALSGRGTVAERIVGELDAVRDFYFGPMSQVQASHWSSGRLVLLGDAAHCPTPFTGKGTALALVGAYVLAGEIMRCASHTEAFDAYETILRPYVEKTQQELTPRLVRMLHVKTRSGIAIARFVQRLLGSRFIQYLLAPRAVAHARSVEADFALPRYQTDA